jgi:hypothetical protein
MASASVRKQLLDELNRLGSEQQRRVLDFARALATDKPLGVPGKTLLAFAGAIPPHDLQTMSRVIEEGCEKVDLNAW